MRSALTIVYAAVLTALLGACGGSGLQTKDARSELRDCRRKADNGACIDVGVRYLYGHEAPRDLDRARQLFERACTDDSSTGCEYLGYFILETDASGAELGEAVQALERSCRRYNIGACDSLIRVLEGDNESVADPERAERMKDRLCTLGHSSLCLRDTDEDGIDDELDQCPEEPEDFDGFEDEDGCPDGDNDQDGVPDADDLCPNAAEDFDAFEDEDGCPDDDNDQDGIPDVDDLCPNEAEDFDGFEDEDGCPDGGE